MTIYNKSGNISTYAFKNIRVNKGLNDALFKWRN
jgi:outer membrane lipoprotein-sorting protein